MTMTKEERYMYQGNPDRCVRIRFLKRCEEHIKRYRIKITPKYELTYDDCEEVLRHSAKNKKWEGPGSLGEWRCPGCGIHRGGL